jgi:hypothetical protein
VGKSWRKLFMTLGTLLSSGPVIAVAATLGTATMPSLVATVLFWTVGIAAGCTSVVGMIWLLADASVSEGDWEWKPLRDPHASCHRRLADRDREIRELQEALVTLRLPSEPSGKSGEGR